MLENHYLFFNHKKFFIFVGNKPVLNIIFDKLCIFVLNKSNPQLQSKTGLGKWRKILYKIQNFI